MKLDPSYLHFISRQQLRILAAIEMGMRNHEYVTAELIARIGNLRGGQTFKTIQKLLKNKFITHIGNKCNGYKLTYLGYDYLALNTLMKRGLIKDVLGKIGVGKESDIYKCVSPQGEQIVLKLTRLGRNSFRSIKKNREYIQHRTNYNWLYLSRLSSTRQFLFMQMLHQHGFPTPRPIDTNRHATLMSLVDGDTFCHIQKITSQAEIKKLFEMSLQTLVRFAKHGLIHGDYNEFNLMVNADGTKLTVIDFPQCISVKHPNAKMYFDRDVECVYTYFDRLVEKSYSEYLKTKEPGDLGEKRFNVEDYPVPQLEDIQVEVRLDHQIKTLGHITLEEYNLLERYRTEEERMRAEMEGLDDNQEEEPLGQQGQQQASEPSREELQQQEKQFEEIQKQLDQMGKGKDIVDIQQINEIEEITVHKEQQKYDEELRNLIDQFGEGFAVQANKNDKQPQKQAEDDSSQQEQRFKGLTPYQIRHKIKQQKRIEREKKKQALSTEDYIKTALKRGNGRGRPTYNKGNHGVKGKIRQTNIQIRDNMF